MYLLYIILFRESCRQSPPPPTPTAPPPQSLLCSTADPNHHHHHYRQSLPALHAGNIRRDRYPADRVERASPINEHVKHGDVFLVDSRRATG